MTGIVRRSNPPVGPPWSVELLADLHAGVLDDSNAAELWPVARADPDACSVLEALDATRADLAALPPLTVPGAVAARLDAALAIEAHSASTTTGAPPMPSPTRRHDASVAHLAAVRLRRRRTAWGAVALVAAAAGVLTIIAAPLVTTTPGHAVAQAPGNVGATAAPPVALVQGQLGVGTAIRTLNTFDYGPLADPGRLAACLLANGVQPDQQPAGVQQVTLASKPGVLIVLTTGQLGRFRLLVVGLGCAQGHPETLASAVVGGTTGPPAVVPTH